MYFFFAGYLTFLVLLNRVVEFPLELITGSVFFGGALFVFLVIRLNRNTIRRIQETEEIERERDKAQNYLDVAGVIFLVLDELGKVVRINKNGCEILGYAEDDIIGKNWLYHFISESKRDEIQRVIAKIIS